VDTCVVIDVLEGDPKFGLSSTRLMDKLVGEGLAVCPVSFIELAPAFLGDLALAPNLLSFMRIKIWQPV